MTMNCVFCKKPDIKYTCCLANGCKICEYCFNELFVETKYGFSPKDTQYNWHNCPDCQKEIVYITWIGDRGAVRYQMSAYRFVKNIYGFYNGIGGLKYSS